jgi:hypothetical protein
MNMLGRRRSFALVWLLLALPGARAECLSDPVHTGPVKSLDFITGTAPHPGAAGFSLATLRDGEAPELVSGGYQRGDDDPAYRPSIGILYAREQVTGSQYRIRAALALPHEYLVYAAPVDGTLFGVAPHAIVVVTQSKDRGDTRVNLIDGASWALLERCTLPVTAAAATIGPDTEGGPARLYVQDADAIHIYSLPDFAEVRTLPGAGGTGFAVGQFDDDAAEEIVLAATPGRIVDAISGNVEWQYDPGFGEEVVSGHFGFAGHDGFLTRDFSGVHVFSTSPYAEVWMVAQEEFSNTSQQMTVADLDGDARDEVAVAGRYQQGSMEIYSVRVFDAQAGALLAEDRESSLYPEILSLALLRDGTGTMQVVEGLEDPEGIRIHPLGATDAVWNQPAESGPFVFAHGAFLDGATANLAYGATSTGFPPRVHVIDALDWTEATISPPNGDPNAIPLWSIQGLLGLHANGGGADRLAIGGSKWFGSIATVEPADWHADWQIGGDNSLDDSPLGERTPQSLVAYDVNGDGIDDVIVGAGELGGSEAGIMAAAFDGATGNVLWRSAGLGGLYPQVSDVEIVHGDAGDRLLVGGSEALYVFDPVSGALLRTVPQPTTAVTMTSDGLVVVGTRDGTLRAFDRNWKTVWQRGMYGAVTAIAQPAPGTPLLVVAASRLRWIDASATQLATSPRVVSELAAGNRWSLRFDAATRTVDIIAASAAGLHEMTFAAPPPDAIFQDGLE